MAQQSCIIEELPADEAAASSSSTLPAEATEAARREAPAQHDAAEASAEAAAPEQQQEPHDAVAAAPAESAAPSDALQQADDPQVQQLLAECDRLKQEGNAAYARGEYDEALQLYWQAIDQAPEGAQQRAVYLCNAAACYLKKDMWQMAVEQCTQALTINDTYIKALMRRAQALQQLDDLERALADAQRVLELEPGSSWAAAMVKELQPEVQQRQEKMKEEMIGKLKDLGNNLLGKIGLSLDNFKAEQDPATGGYSIKFVQ